MRPNFSTLLQKRLEDTVRKLCPVIEHNIFTDTSWTEYSLRKELIACILGSQVRYEMAALALERLEQAGLLADEWWCNVEDRFELEVFEVLSGRTPQYHGNWCYRFPKARAHQLAETRNAIAGRSLYEWLFNSSEPKHLRQCLVLEISGLGPKQASMFLRNIGISYNLAILDTHVLRFMNMQNILCLTQVNISTLTAYERTESIVINYSKSLGYPVGYLDWAIWATMKAAREMGL